MTHRTVVVLDHPFANLNPEQRILAPIGADVVDAQAQSEEDALQVCRQADAVLVRRFPVTRRVIKAMERCVIICNYGAGYDNIDVPAARERGIEVANTSGYADEEVADHTLALLLALSRRLVPQVRDLAATATEGARVKWSHTPYVPVRRLRGQTLGIVGFGRIGQTVARKALGIGLHVIAADPAVPADAGDELGVALLPLPELLQRADFVSLHTPLLPQTHHLLGESELRLMKPTAYLLNCARGGIVDQGALLSALQSGRLAGAGLDVLEEEPPSAETLQTLLDLPNVVVTPHVAWYSKEAIADRQRMAAETVRRALQGVPTQ
ncbi:MAG TPA: C-terminal binding protein [Chloroflexota bacterium]|nr:C-terminal binding protein [Chloroflexota bacterium]